MISIFIEGFSLAFSLIVAIGTQNSFVLKQGLKKEHILVIVFLSIFFDLLLIGFGVFGLGFIISQNKFIIKYIAIIGIIFLVLYAFNSVKSAIKAKYISNNKFKNNNSLKELVVVLLVLTFLNPHVYLDTVLLIGGKGATYTLFEDKLTFFFGCSLASFLWFLLLGYGARFISPLFNKNITWVILDIIIAVIMLLIAYSLFKLL
jgi:L-lysine exporter family protein LysE/ArgO